jgi:hypothetical protein
MFGIKGLREEVTKLSSDVRTLEGWKKGYTHSHGYFIGLPQWMRPVPIRPAGAEERVKQLEDEMDLLLEYLQVEKQTTPEKTTLVKVKRG